jgi:hypothetical protein
MFSLMENWEFLLQKQGDKSWLPLESPTVEILEGHYRLASRTKLVNALVGIQLSYIPSSGIHSPSRQKFSKRINSEGLLIVMPYTHFTAGTWQIECINLEQESQKSNLRSVSICFEVQPISADLTSDWQLNIPQLDAPIDTSTDLKTASTILSDEHSATSFQPDNVEESISEIKQIEIETETETDAGALASAAEPSTEQPQVNNPESDLVLAPESVFLAKPDELNVKSGDAAIVPESSALPLKLITLHQSQYLASEAQSPILSGISYLPGELEVILRNPQDLEIVMHAKFPLKSANNSNDPIDFDFELQIPVHAPQVTIGEVRLHPSTDRLLPDDQSHIYYQAIAVTCRSQNILSEVARELADAAQHESVEKLSDPRSDAIATNPTNSGDNISNVPSAQPPQLPLKADSERSANKNLAAKLDRQTRLPELPKISPLPKMQSGSGQGDRAPDNSEIQLEQLAELSQDKNATEPELQYELEALTDKNVLSEPPTDLGSDTKSEDVLKSLQVDNSFLDKLRSLTKEAIAESLLSQQVSELIESEVEKLESEIEQSLDLEDLGDEFEQMLLNDELLIVSDRAGESIVEHISEDVTDRIATTEAQVASELLEDTTPEPLCERVQEDKPHDSESELLEMEALQEIVAAAEVVNQSAVPDRQSLPTLPAHEPVPAPTLEIPEGEAIAGFPLLILIKLPIVQPKLFVKFWVKDCQTRNIIDGPRWLVDFQWGSDPDYLTLSTPITLPLGVMEVIFEAITIEMQTQRESRKTSVLRSVAPPNLSLDDDLDFDPPDN